jgi:REP element-mobilizing transposase RayT
MARPLRLEFPGAVYHITARGNAREPIFADDRDRQRFVELYAKEIDQQRWRCYAWCLMDNHYHLLFETPQPNLVAGMRRLNQVYTQSFNRRHGRVGHVFQGRYKSIVVEKQSHLLELCRYVVLNPVRAGMVPTAEDWPWSSYRRTVGMSATPPWLRADWLLRQLDANPETARAAYRRFVAKGMDADSPWQSLRGQIWLGGEDFRIRMSVLVARQDLNAIPKEQTRPDRPTPKEVVSAVADAFEISPDAVPERSHQPAFKAAVYLLRRACNLSLREVARFGGVSPSRISRIQAELEKGEQGETIEKLLRLYKVKH